MVSSVRRRRAERERYIASLFSASTVNHKIKSGLAKADVEAGTAILARLDEMPAVTQSDEQREGLVLGAKLRALYLSGSDLNALGRAVDIAMIDHRDLQAISETAARYAPEWPGTSRSPRTAPDGLAAFDEFVVWLAK